MILLIVSCVIAWLVIGYLVTVVTIAICGPDTLGAYICGALLWPLMFIVMLEHVKNFGLPRWPCVVFLEKLFEKPASWINRDEH